VCELALEITVALKNPKRISLMNRLPC